MGRSDVAEHEAPDLSRPRARALSLSRCPSVCLSVCLFVCLSVSLFLSLAVCRSVSFSHERALSLVLCLILSLPLSRVLSPIALSRAPSLSLYVAVVLLDAVRGTGLWGADGGVVFAEHRGRVRANQARQRLPVHVPRAARPARSAPGQRGQHTVSGCPYAHLWQQPCVVRSRATTQPRNDAI